MYKKEDHLKRTAAILDVSNSDPQEHEISYTWEMDSNAPEFLCVQELVFLRIVNWKHLGLSNENTAKNAQLQQVCGHIATTCYNKPVPGCVSILHKSVASWLSKRVMHKFAASCLEKL